MAIRKILFDQAEFVRKESNQQALILPKQAKVKKGAIIYEFQKWYNEPLKVTECTSNNEEAHPGYYPFKTISSYFVPVFGEAYGKYIVYLAQPARAENGETRSGMYLIDPKDVTETKKSTQ